jgi:hypothetical protein
LIVVRCRKRTTINDQQSTKDKAMKQALDQRLDRLDADLLKLLKELESYDDERLNQSPRDGGWSPLQVLQHLKQSEELSLRYLQKKLSFNPELKGANLLTGLRGWLLRVYLWAPLKFKAPKNVDTTDAPRDLSLKKMADAWLKNRRELRDFLATLPEDIYGKEVYRHPFAGRLTVTGMVDFFEHHFRRHAKQAKRALGAS